MSSSSKSRTKSVTARVWVVGKESAKSEKRWCGSSCPENVWPFEKQRVRFTSGVSKSCEAEEKCESFLLRLRSGKFEQQLPRREVALRERLRMSLELFGQ